MGIPFLPGKRNGAFDAEGFFEHVAELWIEAATKMTTKPAQPEPVRRAHDRADGDLSASYRYE
jgi:hypothetical protein